MHLVRCTPREAIRAGGRFGIDVAGNGANPARVLRETLARWYWTLQPPRIRRAFAYGFKHGYRAAVEQRAPAQH